MSPAVLLKAQFNTPVVLRLSILPLTVSRDNKAASSTAPKAPITPEALTPTELKLTVSVRSVSSTLTVPEVEITALVSISVSEILSPVSTVIAGKFLPSIRTLMALLSITPELSNTSTV